MNDRILDKQTKLTKFEKIPVWNEEKNFAHFLQIFIYIKSFIGEDKWSASLMSNVL
jgi:hypothetical protein